LSSGAAVHVSFPDPWWKRRHRKRRLLTPAFARELGRVLEPGGVVWLATDVAARFEEMTATLGSSEFEVERLERRAEGFPETNFETKYRLEGRPLHYAKAIKR
jgi:tRNA (guanine-N7-)-methyltransferase